MALTNDQFHDFNRIIVNCHMEELKNFRLLIQEYREKEIESFTIFDSHLFPSKAIIRFVSKYDSVNITRWEYYSPGCDGCLFCANLSDKNKCPKYKFMYLVVTLT